MGDSFRKKEKQRIALRAGIVAHSDSGSMRDPTSGRARW
jgi:hypothetical protein